jgi:hypothetical protein
VTVVFLEVTISRVKHPRIRLLPPRLATVLFVVEEIGFASHLGILVIFRTAGQIGDEISQMVGANIGARVGIFFGRRLGGLDL